MAALANKRPARMGDEKRISDGEHGDIVKFALENNFDGVDSVLARDPDMINAQKSESGLSALMGASGRGLDAMVTHLLQQPGIDLYLVDDHSRDALDHSRFFPRISAMIVRARHPGLT